MNREIGPRKSLTAKRTGAGGSVPHEARERHARQLPLPIVLLKICFGDRERVHHFVASDHRGQANATVNHGDIADHFGGDVTDFGVLVVNVAGADDLEFLRPVHGPAHMHEASLRVEKLFQPIDLLIRHP